MGFELPAICFLASGLLFAFMPKDSGKTEQPEREEAEADILSKGDKYMPRTYRYTDPMKTAHKRNV